MSSAAPTAEEGASGATFGRCCDTLVIRDSVIQTRTRIRVDTFLYHVQSDSVREVPVEVVRVQKERYIPPLYRFGAFAFYLLSGVAIALIALRIWMKMKGY